MCDEQTEKDVVRYLESMPMNRRRFGQLSAGAALALSLPAWADGVDLVEHEVEVKTPDGSADCYFVHPAQGKHPGVIIWPDILGLRSAFRQMASRLASSGYSVLVVNPYYREAKGLVVPEGSSFGDPKIREYLLPMALSLTPDVVVRDGTALVSWLDAQSTVDTEMPIGTTGYCMGGSFTLQLAAALPERVGAAASFHSGRLATDAEDSPHLLADKIKAGLLVAIAENDHEKNPRAKDVLRQSFDSAGVEAEIEVYEGTIHGWCPPDSRVYHQEQAERAWTRLLALFSRRLA